MSIFMSKQLKYFMIAMEKRCISKAAEHLCLTRTPLCKKIADLENSLEEKLFIRNYKDLTPTEYALSLYNELLPLYESHLRIEHKIKRKEKNKSINIIFDITIPEILYRYIIASIQSEITNYKIKFRRLVISDETFYNNKNSDNAIFISIRLLSFLCAYKQVMWLGGEASILLPRHKVDTTENIDIYLWQDSHSDYFKHTVNTIIGDIYDNINYITHNLDFSAILYNIFKGNGAIVLPMKTSVIYRNENLAIKPVPGKYIPVFMYHNDDITCFDELNIIKNVLLSYI